MDREFARTTRSASRFLTNLFSGSPKTRNKRKRKGAQASPNLIFLIAPALILYAMNPTAFYIALVCAVVIVAAVLWISLKR
jgi:hypothetical protein